jgi:hypothetical protein
MNNNNRTLHLRHWLTLLMLWAVTSPVCGADTSAVAEDTLLADARNGSRAQVQLQQRFIRDFSEFAGSAENAQSLYGGLRTGSRITLRAHATGSNRGAGTSVLQFNAEVRPMGHGGAFISMALAKQQLVNYGIGRPTPWQIQAALNGGAIIPGNGGSQPVALKGVLAQREAVSRFVQADDRIVGEYVEVESGKADDRDLHGVSIRRPGPPCCGAARRPRRGAGSPRTAPRCRRGRANQEW